MNRVYWTVTVRPKRGLTWSFRSDTEPQVLRTKDTVNVLGSEFFITDWEGDHPGVRFSTWSFDGDNVADVQVVQKVVELEGLDAEDFSVA